jgi:hypothetical protein
MTESTITTRVDSLAEMKAAVNRACSVAEVMVCQSHSSATSFKAVTRSTPSVLYSLPTKPMLGLACMTAEAI